MELCENPTQCPYILSCTARHEHFQQDIASIRIETNEQWKRMEVMKDKFDQRANQMLTRMNVILGGIAVACILLAANILLK